MEFLRNATRSRDKTTKKYRPVVKVFFDEQTLRIIDRFNSLYKIKSLSKELLDPTSIEYIINYIFPIEFENAILKQHAKPMHTSGIQKAIDDINDLTDAGVVASLSNAAVVSNILHLGNKITGVNITTRSMLRDILDAGVRDGTNVLDIANQIRDTGLNEWYENRSLAIARTETRSAYDAGGGIAYTDLGAQNFDVVGCVGTLAGLNDFGYPASYGDFSEKAGSCGVLGEPMNLWDAVSAIHHPNHAGVQVASVIPA